MGNMTEPIIRKYLPADRESCRGLWRELTVRHRIIYNEPNLGGPNLEDYFDEHLVKVGVDNIWVAVVDSKVVGFVGLIVSEGEVEVEPIVVSKSYRCRGVGKRMIEKVIAVAQRLDVKKLSVKPVARNVEAIKFFYNQGFRRMGHIQLSMYFPKREGKKELNLFGLQFKY